MRQIQTILVDEANALIAWKMRAYRAEEQVAALTEQIEALTAEEAAKDPQDN